MEDIKISTVPFGKQLLILQCILLIFVIGVQIWLNEFNILLLFYLVLACIGVILCIYQKFYNSISFNAERVQHKEDIIPWDELKITMFYVSNGSRGRIYYVAFGRDFFAIKDIRNILKQGFYIILTLKRLNIILKKYNKEIKILGELGYRKKLYNAVKKYNENYINNKGY